MSKRNGDHLFGDNHGEELVSYIYGEMPAARRNVFEEHLSHCDDCTTELTAFSDARLGVIEWRREDFEHLATPQIVLPQREVVAYKPFNEKGLGGLASWLETLVSLSNLAKAGLGLAAAALAITVIYFAAFTPAKSGEVAANSTKPIEVPASIAAPVDVPKPDVAPTVDKESQKEIPTRPVRSRRDETVPQQAQAVRTAARPLAPRSQRAETAANRKAPRLNSFEEEEDRSLRLSDLFAEVGNGGGR